MFRVIGKHQQLSFTTSDLAEIGNGKHYTDFRPSNIISIEYRRDEQPVDKDATPIKYPKCHVILLNNDGRIAKIAQRLHEDDAIYLTTQLNKALSEIRRAMKAGESPTVSAPVKQATPTRSSAANLDDIDPFA
jgi:hypothetical protein